MVDKKIKSEEQSHCEIFHQSSAKKDSLNIKQKTLKEKPVFERGKLPLGIVKEKIKLVASENFENCNRLNYIVDGKPLHFRPIKTPIYRTKPENIPSESHVILWKRQFKT